MSFRTNEYDLELGRRLDRDEQREPRRPRWRTRIGRVRDGVLAAQIVKEAA
jgi:hypothetical protein